MSTKKNTTATSRVVPVKIRLQRVRGTARWWSRPAPRIPEALSTLAWTVLSAPSVAWSIARSRLTARAAARAEHGVEVSAQLEALLDSALAVVVDAEVEQARERWAYLVRAYRLEDRQRQLGRAHAPLRDQSPGAAYDQGRPLHPHLGSSRSDGWAGRAGFDDGAARGGARAGREALAPAGRAERYGFAGASSSG